MNILCSAISAKVVIVLSSTVNINLQKSSIYQTNKEERIATYVKAVQQWLEKTNLNIILVENSGHTFEEFACEKEKYKHRFEVITFKETDFVKSHNILLTNSKGISELFAINYAFNNSKLINSSSFIIKITARFFIPELENYLKKYNLANFDCLCQNNRDRCEMVGSHYTFFHEIFDIIAKVIYSYGYYIPIIEEIWKLRISKCKRILVCPTFQIEKTQRGGLNECFVTI